MSAGNPMNTQQYQAQQQMQGRGPMSNYGNAQQQNPIQSNMIPNQQYPQQNQGVGQNNFDFQNQIQAQNQLGQINKQLPGQVNIRQGMPQQLMQGNMPNQQPSYPPTDLQKANLGQMQGGGNVMQMNPMNQMNPPMQVAGGMGGQFQPPFGMGMGMGQPPMCNPMMPQPQNPQIMYHQQFQMGQQQGQCSACNNQTLIKTFNCAEAHGICTSCYQKLEYKIKLSDQCPKGCFPAIINDVVPNAQQMSFPQPQMIQYSMNPQVNQQMMPQNINPQVNQQMMPQQMNPQMPQPQGMNPQMINQNMRPNIMPNQPQFNQYGAQQQFQAQPPSYMQQPPGPFSQQQMPNQYQNPRQPINPMQNQTFGVQK